MTSRGATLGARFEKQPNALNLLRLLLAATIVVHHALDFQRGVIPDAAYQMLSQVPVDGFFAISGFLICRSWIRRPDVAIYLTARMVRVLPGLFGASVVTAFLIAPLLTDPTFGGQLAYIAGTVGTVGASHMDASLSQETMAGVWNGTLWSLLPEVICYLLVAYLGVSGRLGVRSLAVIAVLCWVGGLAGVLADVTEVVSAAHALPRLGLMFACGGLLWLLADRVPMTRWVAVASALTVVGGSLTPNYRLLAAPALAYLCLWFGVKLGRWPRLVLSTDLSYGVYIYGWPVQQVLLAVGVTWSWATLSVASLAAALPFAAASWFLIERPAMRLRRRATRVVPVRARAEPVAARL